MTTWWAGPLSTTARSGWWSPLKSPAAMATGHNAKTRICRRLNLPIVTGIGSRILRPEGGKNSSGLRFGVEVGLGQPILQGVVEVVGPAEVGDVEVPAVIGQDLPDDQPMPDGSAQRERQRHPPLHRPQLG